MKSRHTHISAFALLILLSLPASAALKVHGIFGSHMVLQRDKPIDIWGWADPGGEVSVSFGTSQATATAGGEGGLWRVTFPARPADATGLTLTVESGGEAIAMEDILIGDVWVMNGQSNMAWALGKTTEADMEAAQAHLPHLRRFGIQPNESEVLQADLPAEKIEPWTVSTPQTAPAFGAIGFSFGARLQRSLQVPVGIIDNSRGGASIESLVPRHKFKDDPLAAAYLASVEKRQAEFSWDAELAKLVERWEADVAKKRTAGVKEDALPPKPTRESIRSWNVPGRSPSDAAACYNGMFGVFKGLNIKGVLFHQGFNNAMTIGCRPKRYRVLTKLMVEGWREDFNDPALPVGIIGFCAGGISQTRDNFEAWSVSPGAYIRESQRLGLADVGDPENTAFLPSHDVQIPGLHPFKKMEHGVRAARWALGRIYQMDVNWDSASLLSAESDGDRMVLTFDKPVMPDDMSMVIEGFSVADASGKFYMAHAAHALKKDAGVWNTADKNTESNRIHVWSPMVSEPVAVRYAWATSPMGNLKVNGSEWLPLHHFRTDAWDWPESDDPTIEIVDRGEAKRLETEAAGRLATRRAGEAAQAVRVLGELDKLARPR